MLSIEGNASESGPLPPTLVIEMPSTENCDIDWMPPWIEKLPLSSGCTPGSAAIKAYGLVLPPRREHFPESHQRVAVETGLNGLRFGCDHAGKRFNLDGCRNLSNLQS